MTDADAEAKTEVKSELPSDTDLKNDLLEILRNADLEQITKKTVRRQLETKLGLHPMLPASSEAYV